MLRRILYTFSLIGLISLSLLAQEKDTSHVSLKPKDTNHDHALTFTGYVDAYYAYYTDSVGQGNFQKFPTTAPRSNSFGLNMAMFTVKYSSEKIRSIITLHYGDIVLSTWSKDYTYIQEANAGVRISKKIWLDAGFFRSHVGTEGIFGKENITSSVAIGTYNEPYYEAGFKLNYNPTKKLTINLFLLNGYNIIEDNNKKKSFGLLATYAFNDNFNINYSSYFGDDSPLSDSVKHFRTYHNLYLNYQVKKIKIQIGGDFCTQQNSGLVNKTSTAIMYNALSTVRYQFAKKFAVYTRGEIYNDPDGLLSGVVPDKTSKLTGLKLWGVTYGVEFKPIDNSYIRIEGRELQCDANQEIFKWDGKPQNHRSEIGLHIGVHF